MRKLRKLSDVLAVVGLLLFLLVYLYLLQYYPQLCPPPSLFLVLFPLAFVIALIHKRKRTHPAPYMWLARLCCLTPIIALVGIIIGAFYNALNAGIAAGLQTAALGVGAIVVVYGLQIAFARQSVLDIIKSANWAGAAFQDRF